MENNLSFKERNEHTLTEWRNKEMQALDLLQKAGELRFDRSVELVLFRKDIYDTRPSELLNLHQNAANYGETEVTIEDTVAITNELVAMEDLRQARLDIGSLALEWKNNKEKYSSLGEFIGARLKTAQGAQSENIMPRDVILYGFGRIGRLVARRLVSQTGRGEQLRLKAIVIRPQMKDRKQDAEKRAALLRTDSVHGEFAGSVRVSDDGSELIINGNRVLLIYASYPSEIDYSALGINNALVIDNTGVFRTKEDLEQHLRPGVDHVILTAPGKKIPNIVYGVNHESIDFNNDKVLCGASCTTNTIIPPIKILDDAFGIEKGHVETIHSYTSDQNLLDNFHKKPRRGRAAAINMVITSTGAAEAITAVLPYLDGKITGNAVRVPTPNVSLAIINVSFGRPTTVDEVNNLLKQASLSGPLAEQIGFSNDPEYVSTNGVGMTTACVIDGPSTIVSNDGKTVTVYAWYDNEFGYTCQVVRVAKHVGQVRRKTYY